MILPSDMQLVYALGTYPHYGRVFKMTDDEFEQLVDEGFHAISEKFRALIQNVVIKIQDEPSESVRKEMGLSENDTLLGLYVGHPLGERGSHYGVGATYPDTIYIYKIPTLEEADGDPERVRKVVADTVWHEFAHYFGMDEDEVEAKEQKRDSGE